jgi:hypothetical protein
MPLPVLVHTGAEALFISGSLGAALKRRSSTVVRAAVSGRLLYEPMALLAGMGSFDCGCASLSEAQSSLRMTGLLVGRPSAAEAGNFCRAFAARLEVVPFPALVHTGAEALFISGSLDAALKRRSSTVVRAAVSRRLLYESMALLAGMGSFDCGSSSLVRRRILAQDDRSLGGSALSG